MIEPTDLQKGDLILNTLGQTCRVKWIGREGRWRTIIGVDYGNGVECIGYPSAFFWHEGQGPERAHAPNDEAHVRHGREDVQ